MKARSLAQAMSANIQSMTPALANYPMHRLVDVVQQLSLARDLASIMRIVRVAARELTGADGATFVLRDGDYCYYAEENAIQPLWKGQRFPLNLCVSGWAMSHRVPVAIPDIYQDSRVPADAYRPTFVKSLAMVPIRTEAPIGAIGNYWAQRHEVTADEMALLQALANTTAVAMENVRVWAELEQRVQSRTRELDAANRELEAYSHTVSHDLRAPLRTIQGFMDIYLEDFGETVPAEGRAVLDTVVTGTKRMGSLIEDLLEFSRLARQPLTRRPVSLDELVASVVARRKAGEPERDIEVRVAPLGTVEGDASLLEQVFVNLISNAFKYTRGRKRAVVDIGVEQQGDERVWFVRDNGAGFDMSHAHRLFGVFQRLHTAEQFDGTGVGLSIVQRVVQRHGGRIWAEAEVDRGATFRFTLGAATE
jgi:signal transduction histidine kinase